MVASYVPRNDVYLSFCGEHIRKKIIDHLTDAIVSEGLDMLETEEVKKKRKKKKKRIPENVVKAIKEASRVAVVFYSKNYDGFSFCLQSLSEIMGCSKHDDKLDYDMVKRWKDAVNAVANLPDHYILEHNRDESAFIKKIVQEILANKQPRRKLFVSDKVIGKGNNGTIVLEGMYDTYRPVAVKRIMKVHEDVALNETQNLIVSDQHPNVVRLYVTERRESFFDIGLELCDCDLLELTLSKTNPNTDRLQQLTSEFESFKLWKPDGYPSPELLKVMRDIVAGLAHLHELGIIHRDIEPQNVLICKYSSILAKVSDLGISKRLPADMSSLTKSATGTANIFAEDLERLGWLLFFCITGGRHSFGDIRELSSLEDKIPEAFDLISKLTHPVPPESRPTAAEVYHHSLFWDSKLRLEFLRCACERLQAEDRLKTDTTKKIKKDKNNSALLKVLESTRDAVFCGGLEWGTKIDTGLCTLLKSHGNKDHYSVRCLVEGIRNTFTHYHEYDTEIKNLLGPVPTGFDAYFSSRFPNLLIEVYKVLKPYRGEECLKQYYKTTVV